MKERPNSQSGLDIILESFGMRYEYDDLDRINGVLGEGNLPRFVLGRSAEGCVWRFSAGLDADQIKAIARLASREPGFPITPGVPAPPPERLVMIQRLLSPEGAGFYTRHEVLVSEGDAIAELWSMY